MRVSVIIPAWNLWQMTAACLRSLATHSAGQDLEVLVVDNGSTDATVGELEPLGQSLWGAGFKALRLPERGFISTILYHPFFRLRSVLSAILMSMMKINSTRAMENRAWRCRPEE